MTKTARRLATAALAAVALCGFGVLGAPAAVGASTPPQPPPAPTVSVVDAPFLDESVVVPGTTFKVEGAGWPANTLIEIEVCGNEARSGTADCALSTSQVVAADAQGRFRARLAVTVPPTACPCVIRGLSQATGVAATAPVEIPGAPVAAPGVDNTVKAALRQLEVRSATLSGDDSWTTWLGGHPHRSLEFTVVNTGDVAVADAMVSLTVGSSDEPTGFVTPVSLGRLDVYEKKTFTIPVEFGAVAFGEQTVRGVISGTTKPTTFGASTTTYPWLLIALPIVLVLQLVLVLVRNILRRRLHGEDPQGEGAEPPSPDQPTADSAEAGQSGEEVAADAGDGAGDDTAESETFVEAEAGMLVTVGAQSEFYTDDCIICVLEFVAPSRETSVSDRRLMVVRGLQATKQALMETMRLPVAMYGSAIALVAHSDAREEIMRDGVIDAVSILGVDRATVGQAHEASLDLGHWIENEIGLTLFVTNGKSVGEQLFRCDGQSARSEDETIEGGPFGWNASEETYASIFFSDSTSEVDLRSLIPLAVYARSNPAERNSARRAATDAEATEGHKILTIGDFLDELLDRADQFDREQAELANGATTELGSAQRTDASAATVIDVTILSELANAKNGDSLGESPSVSSEPPENTP